MQSFRCKVRRLLRGVLLHCNIGRSAQSKNGTSKSPLNWADDISVRDGHAYVQSSA